MNKSDPWQVEGNAAELYERHLHRCILAPWVPPLLDAVGLQQQLADYIEGDGVAFPEEVDVVTARA